MHIEEVDNSSDEEDSKENAVPCNKKVSLGHSSGERKTTFIRIVTSGTLKLLRIFCMSKFVCMSLSLYECLCVFFVLGAKCKKKF